MIVEETPSGVAADDWQLHRTLTPRRSVKGDLVFGLVWRQRRDGRWIYMPADKQVKAAVGLIDAVIAAVGHADCASNKTVPRRPLTDDEGLLICWRSCSRRSFRRSGWITRTHVSQPAKAALNIIHATITAVIMSLSPVAPSPTPHPYRIASAITHGK